MFFRRYISRASPILTPAASWGYEAILRIFENTASRHSDSSGDDIIEESRNGITWVLTDWRVTDGICAAGGATGTAGGSGSAARAGACAARRDGT